MTVKPHPTLVPQPGILDIAAYVGGESKSPGANRVIKLSSNENPHGPSPKALEAMTDALCDMWSGFTDGSLQKYSDTQHGADGSQTTGSATANEARRFLYRRTCRAKSGSKVYSTDWWCDENCNEGNCPFDQCYCEE